MHLDALMFFRFFSGVLQEILKRESRYLCAFLAEQQSLQHQELMFMER